MRCPVDQELLVMTERNGVEIDYCPTCRGVWLDRGELDKIIERSQAEASTGSRRDESPATRDALKDRAPHKKRSSLLSELFDF